MIFAVFDVLVLECFVHILKHKSRFVWRN